MLDEALVARMLGHPGLTALVGTRVHPGKLPQNSPYPAVTYVQISGTPEVAMGADPGLGPRVYQVSAWAESFATARSVLLQVVDCWERFQGTVAGVVLEDVYIVNELVLWDPTGLVWQAIVDIQVWAEG